MHMLHLAFMGYDRRNVRCCVRSSQGWWYLQPFLEPHVIDDPSKQFWASQAILGFIWINDHCESILVTRRQWVHSLFWASWGWWVCNLILELASPRSCNNFFFMIACLCLQIDSRSFLGVFWDRLQMDFSYSAWPPYLIGYKVLPTLPWIETEPGWVGLGGGGGGQGGVRHLRVSSRWL